MGGLASIPYTPICGICKENNGHFYIDRGANISWLKDIVDLPFINIDCVPYYWCKSCSPIVYNSYVKSDEFRLTTKEKLPDLYYSENGFVRYHS